jgi:phosphatidylglycerophosphate synthase
VITEAVLYLPTPDDAAEALGPVAGRPLAFRMLMAAVRAGCRRVYVPARWRGRAFERAVAASPEARAAIVWLEPGSPAPAAPLLLLPVTVLAPPATLKPLLAAAPSAILAGADEQGAPVAAVRATLLSTLWPRLAAGHAVADDLHRALKGDDVVSMPATGWCMAAAGPTARRALERCLYAELGSPVDTRLDIALHRRLSRPLSRLAVAAHLSANQITVASLLAGLLAAACFWRATPGWAVVGLLLYAVAVVLDHADGEVARLTFSESRVGAWLDVAADTMVHATLMLALGITAGGVGAVFGALAAAGAVASATITQSSPSSGAGGLAGLLDALGNRDGFYAMLVAFILGLTFRPATLPALMLLVAAGTHAFWVGWLVVRLRDR